MNSVDDALVAGARSRVALEVPALQAASADTTMATAIPLTCIVARFLAPCRCRPDDVRRRTLVPTRNAMVAFPVGG
ncbi:hypothetical protein [Actinomadura rayongensis]|uniref:hypothetical protein n=1 Tax=Actinomadura rayongensis TaxID=1429076 RepID=UPI0035EC65C7